MKHGRYQLMQWIRRGRVSQSVAAEELGLKSPQLSKYLTGYATPTLEKALRIQRLTSIPVEAWEDKSVSKRRIRRVSRVNLASVSGGDSQNATS